MSNDNRIRQPLFAGFSGSFADQIRKDPFAEQRVPLFEDSVQGTKTRLLNHREPLFATFLSMDLGAAAIDLVRVGHQNHPALPIFLVVENASNPIDRKSLAGLPIQDILQCPLTYEQFLHKVSVPEALAEQAEPFSALNQKQVPVGGELEMNDSQFVPIRAGDFFIGARSLFDVFVRLSSTKYVKVLRAGDSFSPKNLASFVARGVSWFYIHRSVQEHYLGQCERIARMMLSGTNHSQDEKTSQILNFGEQTLKFLENGGLTRSKLKHAAEFLSSVQKLVQQMKFEKYEAFKGFLGNIALHDHGASTALVSSLMIHQLGMGSKTPVKIVGLSALFHDVSLSRMPQKFQDEDESQLNEDEKKLYLDHPLASADLLNMIPDIGESVMQAVQQHHERRDKSGFPNRIGAGLIGRVSEIISISDEFVRMAGAVQAGRISDPKTEMNRIITNRYSWQVVDSFTETFMSTLDKGARI